jgi:hypothetical protein
MNLTGVDIIVTPHDIQEPHSRGPKHCHYATYPQGKIASKAGFLLLVTQSIRLQDDGFSRPPPAHRNATGGGRARTNRRLASAERLNRKGLPRNKRQNDAEMNQIKMLCRNLS